MTKTDGFLGFLARWVRGLYWHGAFERRNAQEEEWLADRFSPVLMEKFGRLTDARIRSVLSCRDEAGRIEIVCAGEHRSRHFTLSFVPGTGEFRLDGKPFAPAAPADSIEAWRDWEYRTTPFLGKDPAGRLGSEKDDQFRKKLEGVADKWERSARTEYAGVATDYDGTLSDGKSFFVTPEVLLRLCDILSAGVPVAIITNRKEIKGFVEAVGAIVDPEALSRLHIYLDHGRIGFSARSGPSSPYYELTDDPLTLHKVPAVADYTRRIGASRELVAKIGDEGHARKDSTGGDAQFLRGPGSFAVMRWDSKDPDQVGIPALTGLYGASATLWLLYRLRFISSHAHD